MSSRIDSKCSMCHGPTKTACSFQVATTFCFDSGAGPTDPLSLSRAAGTAQAALPDYGGHVDVSKKH